MRIKLTILFLLLSMACFARVGVPTPSEPRPQVDDQGTLLSDSNPAPVKIIGSGAVTISAPVVEAAIASTNAILVDLDNTLTTAQITVGATSQNIAALAGRNFLTVQNTGTQTIYLNAGGAPATTAGYQIFSQGSVTIANVDALATFSVICDTGATSTAIIVQGKK